MTIRVLSSLLFLATACAPGEPPKFASATVRVAVRGPGFVRSSDGKIRCPEAGCTAEFPSGAEIALEGSPSPGAIFLQVTGAVTGTNPTVRLTLDDSKSVTFEFADRSGGSIEWCRVVGGDPGEVAIYAVAASADDHVWATGTAQGTLSLGGATTSTATATAFEPFIAEYATDGGFVQARRFSAIGYARPTSIFVVDGSVSIAGYFTQQVNLGGGELGAASFEGASMVARYQPMLSHAWSRTLAPFSGGVLAPLPDNNTLIGGRLVGVGDLGTGPLDAGLGLPYLAQFDADGGVRRVFLIPSQVGPGPPAAVALMRDGGWALAGPAGTLGLDVAFLAAVTPDGQLLWSRIFGGGTGGGRVTGLAIDQDGDLYATGEFGSQLVLDGTVRPSRGLSDLWLARFRGDGTLVWVRDFGSEGADTGGAVALMPSGVAVSGAFVGALQLAPFAVPVSKLDDLFVAAFDREGQSRWIRTFASDRFERTGALAATSDGALVFAAPFGATARSQGAFVFDGGVVQRAGAQCNAAAKSSLLVRLRP